MTGAYLPGDPSGVLATRLGYLFKHAYFRLSERMTAALAPYGMNPRELGVLSTIEGGGQEWSQSELAGRLGVDRTTMVALIDGLEGKGFVERRRSERDRRRNVVMLTTEGKRCRREADEARERVERDFLAPLDEATAATLTAALRTLYAAHGAVTRPPHCPPPSGSAEGAP
ncbi:MarR family winged helix-turn-helix transcriptional regulator [Streptomyces sp. NBC_00670]|uniref:MarR family winged helix-turn-helix transcriptional regulator n=1 Tax=Streptomyces sp. NBC_00670 TaxID=2975804 RepID=UPI002E366FD7|nr:MarR family winged helix-turn-helix transcriptional regulator [Streptomyces sp. NBC_00670]